MKLRKLRDTPITNVGYTCIIKHTRKAQVTNRYQILFYISVVSRLSRSVKAHKSHRNPSIEQATCAAELSKPKPHRVFHVPRSKTSRRPALGGLLSPASLTDTKHTQITLTIGDTM